MLYLLFFLFTVLLYWYTQYLKKSQEIKLLAMFLIYKSCTYSCETFAKEIYQILLVNINKLYFAYTDVINK